jgi:hypothetical protein
VASGPGTTKVFSIDDFRQGLDVRKTPLTAPGGSLRILENAVLNQGGEIEKRLAFVPLGVIPSEYSLMEGQNDTLHFFAVSATPIPIPQFAPVPMVGHALEPAGNMQTLGTLYDAEAYGTGRFQVTGNDATRWYVWWHDTLLRNAAGSAVMSGTYSRTWKTKMYRVDGNDLQFSGTNDPSVLDPANVAHPGAGFIDLSLNDPEGEYSTAMEVYYDKMAVFARQTTQIWSLDPDPDLDNLSQVLRIGSNAPWSITQFGTGDVLFLSDSGVRSLKALTVNLAASVSDVGSAIDQLLIPVMRDDTYGTFNARSVVQPIQGRYWLYLAGTIYVLSYFTAGNITAWSTFKPGFTIKNMTVVNNAVYVLGSDNTLYLYGGPSLAGYDSSTVTVRTPHQSAEAPTARKKIKSVDVMCEGTWSLSIGMLPNNTEAFELVATVTGNTFGIGSIPFAGYGTHIGAHLVHQAPGPAKLAALHYNIEEGSTK